MHLLKMFMIICVNKINFMSYPVLLWLQKLTGSQGERKKEEKKVFTSLTFFNKNLLLSANQKLSRNTVRTPYRGTSALGQKCQGKDI